MVLPRWQGGLATVAVTVLALVLVVLDISDRRVRHFWAAHALTTDTVAGLLVLALTVLVVDQVIRRRQLTERSPVVAAQAGILLAQAVRSVKAVRSARDAGGERAQAADELRTYLLMLLVGAPVLIEDPTARVFLERAQRLAAELVRVLVPSGHTAPTTGSAPPEGGLDEAIQNLRAGAAPLLAVLTQRERSLLADLSD